MLPNLLSPSHPATRCEPRAGGRRDRPRGGRGGCRRPAAARSTWLPGRRLPSASRSRIILLLAFIVVVLVTWAVLPHPHFAEDARRSPFCGRSGASNRYLLANIALQVTIVTVAGIAVASLLYWCSPRGTAAAASSVSASAAHDRDDRAAILALVLVAARSRRCDVWPRLDPFAATRLQAGEVSREDRLAGAHCVRRSRFLTAGGALTLIVVLILLLGGLLDGLSPRVDPGAIRGAVGRRVRVTARPRTTRFVPIAARRAGRAARSRRSPGVESATGLERRAYCRRHIPGVARVASTRPCSATRRPTSGCPRRRGNGRAWVDCSLEDDGVAVGQTHRVRPGPNTRRAVAGFVDGTTFNLQGAVCGWTRATLATRSLRRQRAGRDAAPRRRAGAARHPRTGRPARRPGRRRSTGRCRASPRSRSSDAILGVARRARPTGHLHGHHHRDLRGRLARRGPVLRAAHRSSVSGCSAC